MRHLAVTSHTFAADDDTFAVVIELEVGKVMSTELQIKGVTPVRFNAAELVELAAIVGQAAAFLAELGFQEDTE